MVIRGIITPSLRDARNAIIASAIALSALLMQATVEANAAVITSLPGGTVDPMPTVTSYGLDGPVVFDGGITWSSTNLNNDFFGSLFGYSGFYGFGANGTWDEFGPMAGLNDSFDDYGVTDTMTFALASPVAGIGGFLNYEPLTSTPTTIAVYDAAHTLIESFDLTFGDSGADDAGFFYGFLEPTSDISFFTLTDNFVAITNLTTQAANVTSAVPEPMSLVLFGTGFLGLGVLRRRYRKARL